MNVAIGTIVFSTIAPTFEQLLTQRNTSGARKVNRLVQQPAGETASASRYLS